MSHLIQFVQLKYFVRVPITLQFRQRVDGRASEKCTTQKSEIIRQCCYLSSPMKYFHIGFDNRTRACFFSLSLSRSQSGQVTKNDVVKHCKLYQQSEAGNESKHKHSHKTQAQCAVEARNRIPYAVCLCVYVSTCTCVNENATHLK